MMHTNYCPARLISLYRRFTTLSPFAPVVRQLTALLLVCVMVWMTLLPVMGSNVIHRALKRSELTMRSDRPVKESPRRPPVGKQPGGMPQSARALPQEQLPLDPPSEQELEAKVSKLEMNPQGEVVLQIGQPLVMSAIPLDADGNIVQGLAPRWESDNRRVLSITRDGQARAGRVGKAQVTATAGQKKEKVKVTVVEGRGPFGGEKLRGERTGATGGTEISDASDARWSRGTLGQILRRDYRGHAPGISFIRSAVMPEIPWDADPLPDDETSSLYTTTNAVGSPPGQVGAETATPPAAIPARERAGSANFTFGVPLVSLPGRAGLDVGLALTYNSRLWHKSVRTTIDQDGNETQTTRLTYDVDNGWPGTGFKLGYGQMESQGSAGFTLTDGDGTRHEMRKVYPSDPNNHDYESTDGTFILFNGGRGWGTVTYTNGTRVEYGAASTGARSYPTKITDRNGNYILITYRVSGGQQVGPQIASVRDTMSRYVYFNYDAGGKLVTITAPHYAGGTARQVARFYYEEIPVSKGFSVSATAPATTSVIRRIYFPGTESGYRYDYSAYGMIYNIAQLRGMTVTSTSLTDTGTVTDDGQEAASTLYNYPVVAGNLSDVPKYTRRTDDWAGRTTTAKPFYTYAVNETLGTTTITAPDASVTETRTIVAEGQWNHGLVSETSVKTGTTVLARNVLTWEHDGNQRNPRIQKSESINEAGQSRTTVLSYTSYNNVSVMSERDFAAVGATGVELRRTETTYETNSAWTGRRLLRLPKSVKVFKGGSTTPASRVDYVYDTAGSNLVERTGIVMHDDAYDPYAPQTLVEGECYTDCDPAGYPCYTYCDPDYYVSDYNPATDKRGNVTKVTAYADAAAGTLATASVNTFSYDVAGNVVTQTASCCQQKIITYTSAYKYAYPTQVERGDAGQLVTKATYDLNTGVVRTTTDENNQVTTIHYWPETLRHFKTIRPDTGYTQHEYNDTLVADPAAPRLHGFIKTTARLDLVGTVERLVTSYQYVDGRGAVARIFGPQTADGYSTTDIEYDSMGRPFRASNPYYTLNGTADAVNPSAKWTKRTFDKLGRVTLLTLPDNNTVQVDYAGDTMTVTDQAGRQRRQILDALDRVERLDEPDATGNLGTTTAPVQATSYVYDALDNHIKITQGAQKRYFKYDSLSRLTHERQVEQDAPHYQPDTLTANNYWSRRYLYDTDSLLIDSYDARQVRAHFDYDGLNRLSKITYTGETTHTPNVFYTYDQVVGSFLNKGRLTQVETKVGTTVKTSEQYNYTRMGQITQHTQTVNGTSYTTKYLYNLAGQLTKETYPSLRAVNYAYDDAGRLASVADAARTYADAFEYAAHGGMLSETLGNSTVHSATYNLRLQPTQLKLTAGATVLQRYDYAYGEVDTATGAVDATKNTGRVARLDSYIGAAKQWQQRYSYDQLGRLTLASEHPGTSTTDTTYRTDYAYDKYGNRSQDGAQNFGLPYTRVRATDFSAGTNRYVSVTGIQYDEAGQITVDPMFRDRQYDYDANGRQRWTARTDGTEAATAIYDGAGQRVETTANGETSQTVYDAYGQVIAEYKGGVWERDYIYRGGQVVATVDAAGSTVRYVMNDLQGSARVTMNASGGILARHDYLPFGEEINAGTGLRTTAQGYGATDERRQKYALLERDPETGQDHAWWRKYENTAGRWTTPDPYNGSMSVGDPQSLNRYSYVGNDPVNFVDPSGLEESWNCYVDGIPVSCNLGFGLVNMGAATIPMLGGTGFFGDILVIDQSSINGEGHINLRQWVFFEHQTRGGRKESEECKNHRANLLGNTRNRTALNEAWNRSQYKTKNAHEEGGLLGQVIDEGQPWQKDVQRDDRYVPSGDIPTTGLQGFSRWARSTIAAGSGTVAYGYWYHTHPFDKGDVVDDSVIGDPNVPSDKDGTVSGNLGLQGVLVTRTNIIVFDKSGDILCKFRR